MSENNIRNFVITAHIDHGKSTLADRLLEITNTVPKRKMHEQLLDMMPLERERGITIKMQPVRMNYILNSKAYTLNLIDTPGHADFGYEVSRALKTVEGAILLVDATQGVEAQTIFNFEKAKEAGLKIIPAINKIDLPGAKTEETKIEIFDLLGHQEEIFFISAKTGEGVENFLKTVIEKVPAPKNEFEKTFKALIFDSIYDKYLGVIAYVRIFGGEIKAGDKIKLINRKIESEVKEVGIFSPELNKTEKLSAGEIGYIATGIKDISEVRVGETIASLKATDIEPLAGYKEPKPVIFASFYTPEESDFNLLNQALDKLHLNDPAFYFEEERSMVLGRGFKCGFLGMLHLEIIKERLKREFGIEAIIFSPSVNYKIITDRGEKIIYTAEELPDISQIKEIQEPWVKADIITPFLTVSRIIDLVEYSRGQFKNQENLSRDKVLLRFEMPLDELLTNFYDRLKSVSAGYASLNYDITDWREGDLVKLEILIAGEKYDPLSKILPRAKVYEFSLNLLKKLKEHLPTQLFTVSLQAKVGGKIIAREDVSARRKDVTGYLYGGDVTRKKKLLEKQKKGKKKLKASGRVEVSSEVLFKLFK